MQRRVPVQQLRGSDATLLEVQVQPLVGRPMGQLAPENVLDLLALAESEDVPRSLKRPLEKFVERCSREITDMPGTSFLAMLGEYGHIDATRVPSTFRQWLDREQDRPDRDAERIAHVLDAWSETEPEAFPIGDRAAKVQRAAGRGRAGATRSSSSRRGSTGRSRSSGGESTSSSRRSAPKLNVGSTFDPEKSALIEKILLERLGGATSNGLAEPVLIAGVRHRAKGQGYSNVSPSEVTAVLKSLKQSGKLSYSAGRWSASRRW